MTVPSPPHVEVKVGLGGGGGLFAGLISSLPRDQREMIGMLIMSGSIGYRWDRNGLSHFADRQGR
jgi:hypothetical protein